MSPFVSETKRDSGMDPCPDPKGVGGWVCVQIPWVGVWVLRWSDPTWLGFRSFSGWTQGVLGLGPFTSGSNEGSGIGLCPDPRGLCGSVSQPKGFGSRSGPKKVGVKVLRWPDPRGLGLFASEPNGVGGLLVSGPNGDWGLGPYPDPKELGLGCGSFGV